MSEIKGLICKVRLITENEGLGYKTFHLQPENTVEQLLIQIAKKIKLSEKVALKEYHLFLPNEDSFLQGTELDPSQTLAYYEITTNVIFYFFHNKVSKIYFL